jgi:hypothetical protein
MIDPNAKLKPYLRLMGLVILLAAVSDECLDLRRKRHE